MKKLFLLSTIAVLFFSCKKDVTTAKKQDDRQRKGAGIETASIIHLETDISVSYENYVCNGERINFTGNIQVTYNARGNDENTMGIQQVTTTLKGVSRNGAVYNVMESSQDKTIITS